MRPQPRYAGVAGMLAGIALVVEFTFFMTSGWSAETFAVPASAIDLLETDGTHLMVAAGFGFIGLALTVLFIAGLASRLSSDTPTLATATLYFGVIGVTAHALVPFGLWTGIPAFLSISAADADAALQGWTAFRIVLDGAHGIGSFFVGLSMLATGMAIIRERAFPGPLGWIALVASLATLFTLAAPLSEMAAFAFLPALVLTMLFRICAGVALFRNKAA